MYKTILAALGAVVLGASASWAAETRYDFEFTLSGSLSTAMTSYGFVSGQTYGGQVFWDDTTVTNSQTRNGDVWDVSVDFTDDPGGGGVRTGSVIAIAANNQLWALDFGLVNSGFSDSRVNLSLYGDFGYFDGLFNTPADRPVLAPPDQSDVTSSLINIIIVPNIFTVDYAASGGFESPTEAVAPVPLPTTAPLLAGGLFVMGWAARRRRVA